jgi:hypothetical protein
VLFNRSSVGEVVSREIFDQAYEILCEAYTPHNKENLYASLRGRIQQIDPDLDIAFIPRTLYELLFIHAAIKEEIGERDGFGERKDMVCWPVRNYLNNPSQKKPFLFFELFFRFDGKSSEEFVAYMNSDDFFETEEANYIPESRPTLPQKETHWKEAWRKRIITQREKFMVSCQKCWHICHFTDKIPGNSSHSYVQLLAYRLNNLLIETMKPTRCFSGQQLSSFLEKEIVFYKNHCRDWSKRKLGEVLLAQNFSDDRGGPGCSLAFSSLGIGNDITAQVLRNALALECNEIAKNAFILYRGANTDLSMITHFLDTSHSHIHTFSFGTGLFSGILYDSTAAPFYFTVDYTDTLTIVIPYGEYAESPFHIPSTHPVVQIASSGEFWHPRSKIPKTVIDEENLSGIFNYESQKKQAPTEFFSNLSAKETYEKLSRYYTQNCYYLTPPDYQESKPQKEIGCSIM